MHLFHVAALFIVLSMVGVEFSVSAFVNPIAWQLDPDAQLRLLSPLAAVLGKIMPIWYAAGLVMLGAETWLDRYSPDFTILLAASSIWFLTILATLLFLVPLNNQVIKGTAGWQKAHRTWDRRHRLRIIALAVAATLVTSAVVRF